MLGMKCMTAAPNALGRLHSKRASNNSTLEKAFCYTFSRRKSGQERSLIVKHDDTSSIVLFKPETAPLIVLKGVKVESFM